MVMHGDDRVKKMTHGDDDDDGGDDDDVNAYGWWRWQRYIIVPYHK